MTDQPYIQVGVADSLNRIEAKLDNITQQLMLKADQATVHELESRVRVLESSMASSTAVNTALSRSRGALWSAIAAVGGAAGAIGYVISQIHH